MRTPINLHDLTTACTIELSYDVKNRQIGHGHKLTIVLSNYGFTLLLRQFRCVSCLPPRGTGDAALADSALYER